MGSIPSQKPRPLRAGPRIISLAVLAAALCPAGLLAQGSERLAVTAVRFWSFGDVTRIAIETNGEVRYKYDRLSNPSRIYFDLFDARQRVSDQTIHVIPVGDSLLKQIRVAETLPAVTRVVLDLEADVEYTASQLANPDRLMVELRAVSPKASEAPPKSTTGVHKIPEPEPAKPREEPPPAPVVEKAPSPRKSSAEPKPEPETPAQPQDAMVARPAQRNRGGYSSLTRVLGLKLGRVVIDPGHGGHDTGSIGPGGLMEKDLVLDIAKRLGALIEERMGSEVIYTRTEDVSVPLEARTQLANDKKADLFVSIHANSSRLRSVSGAETFYLNFTTSRADLEVAARENAGSQKSIHELTELIQKIALKDKLEESREFAARVQDAIHEFVRRNTPGAKNRGVKKAPFVVLIGASMPSVLVEVGFISNAREESLMKRPDQRQLYAEALYKGLSQYAGTLSHFQVAKSNGQ